MKRHNTNQMGFTLIEVLIAILILALGLLGLGAVFPVVISQQRNAVSIVEGESVASMAEAIVRSSPEIIDFSLWFDPADPAFAMGKDSTSTDTFEWIVGPQAPYNTYLQRPGFVNDNGGPSFDGSQDGYWYPNLVSHDFPPTVDTDLNKALSVGDRLIPQAYSGQDPKYVWDLVARRQQGTNRPQLGIFIRQIDRRINVPLDATLGGVLVTNGWTAAPVLPVAIDKTNGRIVVDTAGDDGDDIVYAAPQTLSVSVHDTHLDWLVFDFNVFIDTSVSYATKPGQLLLDNTGTVRKVLGPPQNDASEPLLSNPNLRVIRVNPPFSPSHASNGNTVPLGVLGENERASWIRQVVFTPRTPLAIRVITLEENSP